MPAPTDAQWAQMVAAMYGVNIAFGTVATVMVCLRSYARFHIQRIRGADDIFLVLALICTLVYSGVRIRFETKFLRNNGDDIDPSDLMTAYQLTFASQTVGFISHVAGRFAVCILLYRILSPNRLMRIVLQSIMVTLVLTFFVSQIAVWLQWPSFNVVTDFDTSIKLAHAVWGCYIYWCILDFFFAVLPIHMLWKLQIPMRRKLLIGFLLGLGIFTGICSAVKLQYLFPSISDSDDNVTFSDVTLFLWNSAELYLTIITVCLAVIRPLILKMMGRPFPTPQYRPSALPTGTSPMFGRSTKNSRTARPDQSGDGSGGGGGNSRAAEEENGSTVSLSPVSKTGFSQHGKQPTQSGDTDLVTVMDVTSTDSRASSMRHVEGEIGAAV